LHPANAETVNYVSARSDVQSTFFVVLGLVLYQYSSFCRKYFVYLIPIVIGGLAKPTVVMFAPILLFYMLLFEEQLDLYQIFKKEFFKKTVQSLIKALPSFIVCVILYWFINEMTPNSWQPGGYSPFLYLITQPFVITHYFFTFFAPISLSADSDWQLIDSIWNYQFFIGILFILFLVFIAFKTSKKAELRPISFGILWFFFALIPTSSIIPLGEVLNDHRMFFPFIGLAMAVAWAIGLMIYKNFDLVKNSNYKNYIFITGFLFLSAYAFGTYQRNKVWHSGESLWWDVVNKSPNNGRALMNYGLVLMGKGDYKGALEYYTKAKETVPNYSTLYINIAIAKKETGDIIGAENCYKKAIELNKFDPNCYSFYSKFLIAQKRNREAASLIENGLSLSPKHQDLLLYKIQNDLALSDSSVNSQNSKSQYLLKLSQTYPTPENYINLSLEYYNEGNYQKCIDAAQQALILKPDYDLAYNNICAAYNRLKKWDKAIEAGNKGISINPNNQLLRNNLNESLRFAK
jgi:tetratricopeptide (TPR) repeat protein